ncbi:hypothetical protein BVRB_3g068490 [Beta vulgaris subsp. vulgaris]|nr:hypothetical protein BVRB_3g068490 [Beta vulgaris subsp. vulgaris]
MRPKQSPIHSLLMIMFARWITKLFSRFLYFFVKKVF